jgi:hypothetical protein
MSNSSRLIRVSSTLKNPKTRNRLLALATKVRVLSVHKLADGGIIDRAMSLRELGPLFELWTQANKAFPKVIPEPPGALAQAMFAAGGVPLSGVGRVLLTFVSQITQVKPGLIRYMMQIAIKEGTTDQAAAMQQAEAKWDQLVAPLRSLANSEGLDDATRRTLSDAVGQAG